MLKLKQKKIIVIIKKKKVRNSLEKAKGIVIIQTKCCSKLLLLNKYEKKFQAVKISEDE